MPDQIKNCHSVKDFKIKLDDLRNNGEKKQFKRTFLENIG